MSDPPGKRTFNNINNDGSTSSTGSPKSHHRSRLVVRSLEPTSMNESVYSTGNSNDQTVTTPTGSIEIVHSQKSLNSPLSVENTYSNTNPDLLQLLNDNQENEYIIKSKSTTSTTMRFTNPIATSPLSVDMSKSITSPTSVGVPVVAVGPSSPLMMNTANHGSTTASSPRMQLPLPPGGTTSTMTTPLRDGNNRPVTTGSRIASSTTGSDTTTSVQHKQPHVTPQQKALKFSSLKKRKQQGGQGSNALLNRLFCNVNHATSAVTSFYVIPSNNSLVDECDNSNNFNSVSADSGDGVSNIRNTLNNVDVSACVKISTSILQEASESLTLHDEDKVRADVQSALQDTLDIVCSPNENATTSTSSPPTYCSTTKVSAFLSGSSTKNSPVRYKKCTHSSIGEQPSDESIESSGISKHLKVSTAAIPFGGSTQLLDESKTKLWNSNYDHKLADDVFSQPNRSLDHNDIMEKPHAMILTKARSSEDNMRTPIKQLKSTSKPMKTPGGLVIPSPFTHNTGKGLFPNTFGNTVLSLSSYVKSSSAVTKMSPMESARKITSLRKETKSQQQHPIPIVYIPDMATTSSTSTTVATSTATTSEPLSPPSLSSQMQNHRSPDRIEKQRDSPILVRITSSLEDLETVPEVTTSKEFDEVTTTTVAGGVDVENATIDGKNNLNEIDETEFLPNRNTTSTLTNIEQQTQRLSKSPVPSKDCITNFTSLDDLKAQYEHKISEQKDRISLSNRVAKMRLDEIERLESIMDTLKDRPSSTDETTRLKDRLQQLQQEKKKDIERVRKEVQLQFEQQNQNWIEKQNKYQSMEEELLQVKQRLVEAETSARPMITLVSSNEVNDEVERLKVALADANKALVQKENNEVVALKLQLISCRKELATAIASSEQINQSIEIQMSTETERLQLQEELAMAKGQLSQVTAALIQKEKELLSIAETTTKSRISKSPSQAAKTLNRYTSPATTPVRSGSKTRSRMSIPNESKSITKQRENINEMNEREKETLREQIVLLNAQATETSQEHDRALTELRKANESEITRIKAEMQSRLDNHKLMEQELKESLSAASSTEREELLEQIEILQAEKKLDQLSGLRDVQKREELLQRIANLEQKDKALVESHERAVEELLTKNEAELQMLRRELQSQEKKRLAREKEIESSLAESYSFEKNALTQKIETLEGQLESERSGVVLLRIKLSNIEKDMEALKEHHRLAIESQKASTRDEIQSLRKELNDRLALEEAMQITTNERDTFEEELQLLKVKYDQDTRQHVEKMEEMKRMHSHERTVTTNDLLSKIKNLENELDDSSRNVDQMSRQKCEELKATYDQEIETLIKNHADEIGKIRLEMHSVEEKYKVLVTESNVQFESFQKDSEGKIEELMERLRTNEERYKEDLKFAESNASTEDKKLLDHYEELKKLQAQHESQMKAAEASHNKHFEDLLAQLDLVEAEQLQTTAAKNKALSEKDTIVDALGSQLAEAQRKITEALRNRAADLHALEESRKSCQGLESQTQTLRDEVRDLKEMQKKFVKEAEIKREKACEDAREEMIDKAEIQFQQANEHYIKLRKQYDESQERVKKFESELKLLRKKIEKITTDKESVEIDLKAEIAQMHAANAKIEAESAQKAKEYRRELERLLQTAKNFEAKAEEATTTSRSIQTTLATMVAEKQKLQQEYEEMKSVSEELMAIVEGGERREC